jgi:hypothetical protein
MKTKFLLASITLILIAGCGEKEPTSYVSNAEAAIRKAKGLDVVIVNTDVETITKNVCGYFKEKDIKEIYYFEGKKNNLLIGANAKQMWDSSCGAWKRSDDLRMCKDILISEAKRNIDNADWNIEKRIDECMARKGHKL